MERFWSKVETGDPAACWWWTAAKDKAGYGVFSMSKERRYMLAHRASWELHHGMPPPQGLFICHHCDNKGCVNPAHLFAGTPKENTQDMIRKGRRVVPTVINRPRGDNHPSRTKPECLVVGEFHHSAKLTNQTVREIRASSMNGNAAAKHYGVTPNTISRVRRRLIWRHVA